jgi:hypothetical protein
MTTIPSVIRRRRHSGRRSRHWHASIATPRWKQRRRQTMIQRTMAIIIFIIVWIQANVNVVFRHIRKTCPSLFQQKKKMQNYVSAKETLDDKMEENIQQLVLARQVTAVPMMDETMDLPDALAQNQQLKVYSTVENYLYNCLRPISSQSIDFLAFSLHFFFFSLFFFRSSFAN